MPQITSAGYNLGNSSQTSRINNFDKNNLKPNNILEEKNIKGLTTQNIVVNNIPLDAVINSINGFKTAIYNNFYLLNLVNKYKNEIISAGRYDTVLQPIIEKSYLKNETYFWLVNAPLNNKEITDAMYYFTWKKNSSWNNLLVNDIPDKKAKKIIVDNYINAIPILNALFQTPTYNNTYYSINIHPWLNGLQLYMYSYTPDILNKNKWIKLGSGIDLISYFPKAIQNNFSLIPQEYITFIKYIKDTITYLNKTNWKIEDINSIWQLTSIAEFPSAKCLLSTLYPDWTGKFISECFIPNSNFNHPSIMSNTVIDLNNSYPTLTSGQFVITTNIIENSYYISLIQITVYDGIKSFKEKQILVNDFFKNSITANGDVLINGNLDVRTFNNISVIQTDNVTQNISIHGKVGINQDLHEIKGLLDIDNLSNENILTIVDKIADLNNTSYNVVEQVKDTILNNGTFNISPDYTNEIVVFKVPIKIKIEESDISFLHKPSNIFKINKFSSNSFLKIQIIINEINKMNVEIDNYNTQEGHKLIMSFVELLNDREYYYICSLKAIFKDTNIYFVMSFTLVQNIMVDNSYSKIFTNLINAFSSINRLLNYSILVVELPEIYNQLIEGDSVNSFTKYIQESEFRDRFGLVNEEYFGCIQHFSQDILDENNIGKFLLAEQYPNWNLQFLKDLFIPNTDIKISDVSLKSLIYYKDKYGLYKNSQNFICHFIYDKGERITFLNKIFIKGNEYRCNVGINIFDYIDLNIISTGDNKITGNLYIQDENKTNIFSVDTEYNKITNMYKTGFGTEYPKTILDVNDSGLTDIINIIKDMANKEHALNLNIGFIKNLETINADNIDNCINTQFIDPTTGETYIQNKDDYFYCQIRPINDNPNEIKNIYVWLYRNWDDSYYINIDDKNNKTLINTSINNLLNEFKTQYSYDNFQTIIISDWTFGKKFCSRRLLNKDDKQYIFGNGTNIGNYNLKINNNGNISAFFDYIKYMNLYLQNFIIRLNNIATTSIPNYNSVNDHFSIISNVVSPKQFKLKKIVADFTDFTKTKVYDIDFYTQAVSGNDSNKTIYQIQDINERSKYVLMLTNINSIYSKNNNNPQLFNIGDYGIINLEDNFVDYLSLFYCSDITATSVTLISMELQINTIIQPSVDIRGDLRIKGDTYFHNNDTNTDFVCIDTNDSFIGIGTNKRYVNYNTSFLNTTQGNLGRHTFIVSGSTFPVAVIERYAEIIPTRDSNSNAIINYPSSKLELFRSKSTLSVRRSSSYYDINELNDMSKKYTTTKIAGPYIGQIQKYNYGTDINFEIMDKSDITYNMGKLHVGIDDISNNRILAGFGFSVIDNTSDNKTSDRNLMYINNNGIMNIDKITLGMDTTTTNNVLLSASNNDLLINNVTLTDIINNKINSMFSVNSTSGNLNITYNGIKYECNKI